jgi:hypothetical protein
MDEEQKVSLEDTTAVMCAVVDGDLADSLSTMILKATTLKDI